MKPTLPLKVTKSLTATANPIALNSVVPAEIPSTKLNGTPPTSSERFTATLVAAVEAAGLVETLKGPGPFTVFAPPDAAFAALPAGTVEDLLKPENKDKLVAILTYHVLPRELTSNEMLAGPFHVRTLKASPDRTLAITKDASGVTVDNAKVIKADIVTDNGVIHVIDTVLLPSK